MGFDQVEIALKAGDNKSVVEMLTKISALQKEGHKEYKRPGVSADQRRPPALITGQENLIPLALNFPHGDLISWRLVL